MKLPLHGRRLTNAVLTAVGLLVLSFAAWVGIDSYRAVEQARTLYDVGTNGMSIEGDLQFFAQESRRTVTYALTTTDPNIQIPYIDQARSADAAIDRLRDRLSRLPLDGATRRALDSWVGRHAKYLAIRDEIIALILVDQTEIGRASCRERV